MGRNTVCMFIEHLSLNCTCHAKSNAGVKANILFEKMQKPRVAPYFIMYHNVTQCIRVRKTIRSRSLVWRLNAESHEHENFRPCLGLRWLVSDFSMGTPGFSPMLVHAEFLVTNCRWDGFYSEYFSFPLSV